MFFPDDAVGVAARSEYVDRWVSDRLLLRCSAWPAALDSHDLGKLSASGT